MLLNERISKIIEHYGLTSSEFADKIEVQRSSISHITSGRNKPSLDILIKVKENFPELSWDWLINGEGEMELEKKEERKSTQTSPNAGIPDLFSIIEDDQFGYTTESEDRVGPVPILPETNIDDLHSEKMATGNSQQLGNYAKEEDPPVYGINRKLRKDDAKNKIVRIVLFYEDGKFESFEP